MSSIPTDIQKYCQKIQFLKKYIDEIEWIQSINRKKHCWSKNNSYFYLLWNSIFSVHIKYIIRTWTLFYAFQVNDRSSLYQNYGLAVLSIVFIPSAVVVVSPQVTFSGLSALAATFECLIHDFHRILVSTLAIQTFATNILNVLPQFNQLDLWSHLIPHFVMFLKRLCVCHSSWVCRRWCSYDIFFQVWSVMQYLYWYVSYFVGLLSRCRLVK